MAAPPWSRYRTTSWCSSSPSCWSEMRLAPTLRIGNPDQKAPNMSHSFSSAAALLSGSPEDLIRASRADMERAKAYVARLKGADRNKAGLAPLEAFDAAMGALGEASCRAGVCRNAHPLEAMRDAAEKCEQEVDVLQT